MFSRKVWIGLAAAALLVTAGFAVAQESPIDDSNATASIDAVEGKDKPGKFGKMLGKLKHLKQKRGHGGPPGEKPAPFEEQGADVVGSYVSFTRDVEAGCLRDYARTVNGTQQVIFESICLANHDATQWEEKLRGPMYGAREGEDARFAAFNARNAAFRLGSPAGNTVTLVVPADIEIAYYAQQGKWSPEGVLLTNAEGKTARLIANKNADVSVDGQTITVTLSEKGGIAFHIDGFPGEVMKEKRAMHRAHDGERPPHGGPRAPGPRDASQAPTEVDGEVYA